MRLRVLLLAEVLHPETVGGAGRVVRELGTHLARVCDVTLVARAGKYAAPPPDGVRLLRVPAPEGIAPLAFFRYKKNVREILPNEPFDIIHAHQPFIGWAAETPNGKPPRLASFYSSWPEEYIVKNGGGVLARTQALLLRQIEREALSRAEEWIVLSEHSRREIADLYPGLERPVTRIPGGVDPDRFRPPTPDERAAARRAAGLPEDAFLLLTVRNLVPRMGLANLLEGLARLGDIPGLPALHLAIAGDGPLRETLRESARARGLESRVTFLGRVEEENLPSLYRAADLFLLPTEMLEGFGLVILEAFASGLPVAATPIGAIPETVGLAGSGFLFGGTDAEAIEKGLRSLLARHAEFPSLAPHLRRIAEAHSWKSHADRTLEVYERLLTRAAPSRSR